jgi:hypothetical protein
MSIPNHPFAILREALLDAIAKRDVESVENPDAREMSAVYHDTLLLLDLNLIHIIGPAGQTNLNKDNTVNLSLNDAVMVTRAIDDAIAYRKRRKCRRSSENVPLVDTYRKLSAMLWRVWL